MLPRDPLKKALLFLALSAAACSPPDAGRPDYRTRAFLKIVEAEDVRHTAGPSVELLAAATRSPDAFLRAAGVRALGRTETPALLADISSSLADEDASVRAEAANAVAQAVHRGDGTPALSLLMERISQETDPGVRGVLARSLGRLSLSPEQSRTVSRTLVQMSRTSDAADAARPQLIGVVLGLESLARASRGTSLDAEVIDRLRQLIRHGLDERAQTLTMVRIRALALSALRSAGAMTVYDVELSLHDPGDGVRRTGAAGLSVVRPAARPEFIRRLLRDPSPAVRYEGVRAIARDPLDLVACTRLLAVASREMTAGVRAAALDALSIPCPDPTEQIALLARVASSLDTDGAGWHEAAHALVSLAHLAPREAARLLPRFVSHASPFVRVYAARTASLLGDVPLLRSLARDESANVAATSVTELARIQGRGADSLLIEVMEEATDPQLLVTTAGLLSDTDLRAAATSVALTALTRLTGMRMQTLRDPRVALLTLIGRVGDPSLVSEVEPYIRDSDRIIADLAARTLLDWTGQRFISAPRTPARLPLPTEDDMAGLAEAQVVLYMAAGGAITIDVDATLAPTNVLRFVSMAERGAFDGLTLHRVVPNFVVQGGSPGANEYAGHGAFTRDEVGLPVQWRGTVGISTRGRDTGDGQFYINLVDNVRLDHDYTVIGRVTSGMETIDGIMEGDVIDHAEVRRSP